MSAAGDVHKKHENSFKENFESDSIYRSLEADFRNRHRP
jgi:hypothetical protein